MVNNQKGRVERYNYDVLINEAVEHGYTTDASITSYLLEIYKSDNKNKLLKILQNLLLTRIMY